MANGSNVGVQKLGGEDRGLEFEGFLREQRVALVHFLRRRMPTEDDAQDATQESMTRMLRYGKSEPASSWKPLLYRIATNIACDQARVRSSHCTVNHVSIDADELPSGEPGADDMIAEEQELALLEKAIMELPLKCRQVFLLHRMEGKTYVEIARSFGISEKMVEKHISKALARLRTMGKAYTATFQES